jgi:phosphatidylglycerol:prolipoprotein diacylglycerol transferase
MHPVLFKFHGLTLYSYGLCVAIAVTLALWLSARRAKSRGLSPSAAVDLLFIAFLGGIAGARVFYVLQHLPEYRPNWMSVFWIQEGGLVWYGGFIFAALSGAFYCRRSRLPVLIWSDLFAPVVALAHGIGRIGCFLNGCCYGKNGLPAQLFESAGLFLIAGLLFMAVPQKARAGRVTAWYLFLYGALRFGVEFLRGDQPLFFVLTLPQWISLAAVSAGLALLNNTQGSAHENKH